MADLCEVIDSNGQPTGQLVSRQVAHANKITHRVVGMLLHDADGRYVVQYRPAKQGIRYFDVSVGGHVDVGESPAAAAVREAYEELGAVVDMRDLTPVATDMPVDDFYPELGVYAHHLITCWIGRLPDGWKFVPNHDVKEVVLLTKDEIVTLCRERPEECTKGFIAGIQAMGWL